MSGSFQAARPTARNSRPGLATRRPLWDRDRWHAAHLSPLASGPWLISARS